MQSAPGVERRRLHGGPEQNKDSSTTVAVPEWLITIGTAVPR